MEREAASRGNDLALVEAALFLASRPLSRRALGRILGDVPQNYVDQLLSDLQSAYAGAAKGIELVIEAGHALLRVKAEYVERVAHLAPQQDIPQPVLRTLAVIAYNHPATQADVVRTRGNKAYEHIDELVERGLVRTEKHGRTLLLHVTDEFLRHFGLSTIDEFRFHVAAPTDGASEAEPVPQPEPETQEVDDG
jgi:segregation and condensation protein B